MSRPALGMWCRFDDPIEPGSPRTQRLIDLAIDARWSDRFRLVSLQYVPGVRPAPVVSGVVARDRLRDTIATAIASPAVWSVCLSVSKVDDRNACGLELVIGRTDPLVANTRRLAATDAESEAWLELQHELVESLGATHGVIVVDHDPRIVFVETSLIDLSTEGRSVHPDPDRIGIYASQRRLLGNSHVRAPGWGTYLGASHLAAIGGRDGIRAAFDPPVIREIDDLTYVQLSERVSEFDAPVTRAKQRAFADLLGPLILG